MAAGCTMVLKPATATPFSAIGLVRTGRAPPVCRRASFPCVTGGSKEIGGEMTSNPIVRKLTFTGSTEVGKLLMEQCAGTGQEAVAGARRQRAVQSSSTTPTSRWRSRARSPRNTANAGQTCVCANRILVQDGVYDDFTKRLAETAGAMKVRPTGSSPGAVIGPLIDMKAVEKVEAHIADAVKKGAKIVTGGKARRAGRQLLRADRADRFVTTDMVITKEETFGPVAPLYRFKERRRGDQDGQRHRIRPRLLFLQPRHRPHLAVAEALEYGIVGINEGIISTEIAPFGGMKESGIGREGSKYGIEEFLEVKYLCHGRHRPLIPGGEFTGW